MLKELKEWNVTKKQMLLNAAESKVREGGYNNFSFRELADEVGIKSASVHYHFPTKADLAATLAENYTNNFLANLGQPQSILANGNNPIKLYIEQFKRALLEDEKMCLCGILAAESDGIPDKVSVATKRFFDLNIQWLTDAFDQAEPQNHEVNVQKAVTLLSVLEGAMMVSKAMDDDHYFDVALMPFT